MEVDLKKLALAPLLEDDADSAQGHPAVTVVIPTFNDAENLPYVLERLPRGSTR